MAVFRKQHNALLVGLFAILAFGALVALVLVMSSRRPGLENAYTIIVRFDDGSGVIEGSLVRMSGAVVGEVVSEPSLTEDYTSVEVELALRQQVAVPRESHILITAAGILGDTYLLIDPPPPDQRSGEYLKPGDVVQGGRGGVDFGELGGKAAGLADESQLTAAELRARLEQLKGTVERIDASAESLKTVLARVDRNYLNEDNALALRNTLDNAARASDNIERASQHLPALLARLDTTLTRTDRAAASLENAASGTESLVADARPAVTEFRASLAEAGRAASELADTLELVQDGEGLTADILTDAELAQDFRDLVYNLRESGVIFYDNDEADERREEIRRQQQSEAQHRWQEAIEAERRR